MKQMEFILERGDFEARMRRTETELWQKIVNRKLDFSITTFVHFDTNTLELGVSYNYDSAIPIVYE